MNQNIYLYIYIQGGILEFLYNIQVIYVKQNKQNKNKGKNRRRNIRKKERQKSNGIANKKTKNNPEALPEAQSLAQSTQIRSKCPNTHKAKWTRSRSNPCPSLHLFIHSSIQRKNLTGESKEFITVIYIHSSQHPFSPHALSTNFTHCKTHSRPSHTLYWSCKLFKKCEFPNGTVSLKTNSHLTWLLT